MSTLKELKQEQNNHIIANGGYLEMKESDNTNSDLNRKQIEAFKNEYSFAFLGCINYYDDARQEIINKTRSVYTEYAGQKICNFEYNFCVPLKDEILENMIIQWNKPHDMLKTMELINKIMNRIKQLNGIHFIWS